MPEHPRDDRPFGHAHAQQRNARGGQRRLHEQRIDDQLGLGREQGRAFMGARLVGGEDRVELADEIAQLGRRQAGGIEARFLVVVDIAPEAGMAGARADRRSGWPWRIRTMRAPGGPPTAARSRRCRRRVGAMLAICSNCSKSGRAPAPRHHRNGDTPWNSPASRTRSPSSPDRPPASGRRCANGLARRGANIIVNYSRSAAEAEETAEAVRQAAR